MTENRLSSLRGSMAGYVSSFVGVIDESAFSSSASGRRDGIMIGNGGATGVVSVDDGGSVGSAE